MSELHYTDAEKIKRLSAWHESEKREILQLRAHIATLEAENARLTAAHAMQGEELVTLPRQMVYSMEDKMKKQAAEIIALKKACIVYHNQIINMQKEVEE